MNISGIPYRLVRAPLVFLLSSFYSLDALANTCDCSREVASCHANVDVTSQEKRQNFNGDESDPISSWKTIVSVFISLPSYTNVAYMGNQCMMFDLSDVTGRYGWSETLYNRTRYATSRTIYTSREFSTKEFYVDKCRICWDKEGEALKEGIEQRRAEEIALNERKALEENFDLVQLQHPDIDLSDFSDEELRQILSEKNDWDYEEALRQRLNDRKEINECGGSQLKNENCNTYGNNIETENGSDESDGGAINNSTSNKNTGGYNNQKEGPENPEKGKGNPEKGLGTLNEPEGEHFGNGGDLSNSDPGESYWTKEDRNKVVIPEGFLNPDNPFSDNDQWSSYDSAAQGTWGGRDFNNNDSSEGYWTKEQQDRVVIPEGFFDPDNPYAEDDPLAAFLNKSRQGWDRMDEISDDVEESRQDYVDADWDRRSSRSDRLGQYQDRAVSGAEDSINRIEDRAVSRNATLGNYPSYPGAPSYPTPTPGSQGVIDEAAERAKCQRAGSPYIQKATEVKHNGGLSSIANAERQVAVLNIQAGEACLKVVNPNSSTYRDAQANIRAYKAAVADYDARVARSR